MSSLTDQSIDDVYDAFEFLDDWEERYRYIIDMGRQLAPLGDDEKTDANKVRGCMSQVWMVGGLNGSGETPVLHFRADSDAHIVRGLIALLTVLYDGKRPEEVAEIDPRDVFARLGLDKHLSPNRRNGLIAMVERIRAMAQSYVA